jgi:hypothetical protein
MVATFVVMENHRTDSIPNDTYPVKSDRLLVSCIACRRPMRASNFFLYSSDEAIDRAESGCD